ncbi:MAG: ABC transporter ATP-binding protein [Gemmatimonas sp.]
MDFLVADSVGKSFGDRRILSSGSLRATRGAIRVVFGRNGIGKSTLLKIAAGRVQADTGTVRVNGTTILRPTLPRLARSGVFYLPDHDLLSPQFPLGTQLGFFHRRYRRRSVEEAAQLAMVESLLHQYPTALSGGELRRAELAAALVRRPDCLLADEPLRGIAPRDRELLTTIFRTMAADGCAVVVTGHEVPSLLDVATHVTWCTSGTTYELGTAEHARSHEQFVREYLTTRL